MPAWPPTLPQHAFMGFTFESQPSVTSFPTDIGIPKARRRSTLDRQLFTTPMELNGEQIADFEEFWQNLGGGVAEFEWKDPVTGAPSLFVFQRTSEGVKKPRWTCIGGGAEEGIGDKSTYDLRRYSGVLELECTGDAPGA